MMNQLVEPDALFSDVEIPPVISSPARKNLLNITAEYGFPAGELPNYFQVISASLFF